MIPPDQPARERAVSPDGSFHLEAPAGSGKTMVLLERFLTLLSLVDDPQELLALTFTRKASGELKTRVMELLWLRQEPPPSAPPVVHRLRDLAQEVFRRHADGIQWKLAPERLPIMTFHSFCAQLLRLAPQEAGVPLDFRLLEDNDAQWLRQTAVAELRRRLAARPTSDPVRQALVRRLVRLNNNWPRLDAELQGLLARRDTLKDFLHLAAVSAQPEAYAHLLQTRFGLILRRSLTSLRTALMTTPLAATWPQLAAALKAAGAPLTRDLPDSLPGTAPADLAAWQAVAHLLLTKDGKPRRSFTVNLGFPPGFGKTQWAKLIPQIPETVAALLHDCRSLTATPPGEEEIVAVQDLVLLLAEALKVFEDMCAAHKALDFIGLEQKALQLLATDNPTELLLRWDYRLRHVLVDEFQDTSLNQLELLCRLLAGWPGESGRSLLVVGDPKQSIYGFRQAKLQLFLEARQGLPCQGGRLPLEGLTLTTNFRASQTLIDWVNRVFAVVLDAPGATERITFHPATPGPGAERGQSPRLALFVHADAQAARLAEGRALAHQVTETLKIRDHRETLGIMLFTRKHLTTYLTAFQEAGLTVRVREGLKLADSRVVQHLHNLARALVWPHDDLAWAAILRGPWGTAGLDLLVQVAQQEGELWLDKLRRFTAASPCPPELAKLVATMTAALTRVGREPLADIIQDLLGETASWPGMAAWEGPVGVANARAYLELLARAETHLPEETYRKTSFLLSSAFQPPDPRAQASPVEVLTVHGAKGLEFDYVFVPFLDWPPLKGEDKAPPFLLEELPGKGLAALAMAKPYTATGQSSLYQALKQLRQRRVLAEARRLFYVAATRARKTLYLSAVWPSNRPHPPLDTPLGWLWQYYNPQAPSPGVTALWSDPTLEVTLWDDFPALTPPSRMTPDLPPPIRLHREKMPFIIQFPSQLTVAAATTTVAVSPVNAEGQAGLLDIDVARIRGDICHRLLETLAEGQPWPSPERVAAALRQEGLAPEPAADLAADILAEVRACLADPFLARLLSPDVPQAMNEWRLEDEAAPGLLRRGRVDRLVYDGEVWWLLDYKTGRPQAEEDWEPFIAAEVEKYRPQLAAYRDMAAKALRLNSGAPLRLVLYFTACQRAVDLPLS